MDGHDSDDDIHPELVVDSDEEDESSSTERARTFASLSDTGHPEPVVARAPGPNEHLDVAARALVRAEGLSAGLAGDLARIFPPPAAASPARSGVPRPQRPPPFAIGAQDPVACPASRGPGRGCGRGRQGARVATGSLRRAGIGDAARSHRGCRDARPAGAGARSRAAACIDRR